jgi:outer membrane protein assembly factor BamB
MSHREQIRVFRFLCAFAPLRERFCLVAVGVALASANVAVADNWPRFRGPNGTGQSDSSGIPTKWEAGNFLWRRPLANVGHSSPVIWENRLFITSGDAKTGAQIVSAFDVASGKPLWEKRFDAGTYHMNHQNSFASSTPAADANHIYLLWLEDDGVVLTAITHDGREVWRFNAGPFEETHGFGKSPVVVDDLVYVVTDSQAESTIAAVDCKTGKPRWQKPRESGNTAFATPCLLDPSAKDKLLLTVSTASGLTAFHAADGKIAWECAKDVLTQRCVGSPVVAGGLVLVSSGQGGNGKTLAAIRPGKGDSQPEEAYRLQQSIPNVPTPVVSGDLLFLWHDRGVVACYDLATGHQNWRERIGGDFHSSPLRIGNRIFCISMTGDAIVLAADRKFQELARNPLKESCHATPAIANDRLYVRTENSLMCIGEPPAAADK